MFIQSEIGRGQAVNSLNSSGGTLLDKACGDVQKLCRRIIGLPQHTRLVDSCRRALTAMVAPCFPAYVQDVTSGEIGLSAGAEGATAPETLRQTDRVAEQHLERDANG